MVSPPDTPADPASETVEPPSWSVRTLATPSEFQQVSELFRQIWGTSNTIVADELLRAISHAGGYVAAAVDNDDHLVGASFGFLGRHRGQESLHSHITGVLPGVQHSGLGRAMKLHQRDWAAARNIAWITWTFDPLVRRNAWFNIAVLGAAITDYLVDFYGPMTDAINSDDESDRLVVAWSVGQGSSPPVAPPNARRVMVPTPDDIVQIRRTHPGDAQRWRERVRAGLAEPLARGAVITGFTREGEYQVDVPEGS